MGAKDLIVTIQEKDVEVFYLVKSRPAMGTGLMDIFRLVEP
jgi:hypothetical protein